MAVETKVAGAKSPISLLPWIFQDEGELSECFEWSTGLDGVGWLRGKEMMAVLCFIEEEEGRRGHALKRWSAGGLIAEVIDRRRPVAKARAGRAPVL